MGYRTNVFSHRAVILVNLAVVQTCFAPQISIGHENEEIEEIVVMGRWDRPNGLTLSASQGFVSQADIDLRPRLRPGDLLEIVPGLVVTQHSGTGKSNQMFLRGFNLDHGTDFASWIDGMPINMPTHGHGQGYTDLNFIIPELIGTLEYRKGPYYTDVSDFSSAGAAFFSTPSKLDNGLVKVSIGEDGLRKYLAADSFRVSDGDLLIGLQSHQYDGPWIGVNEDLERYNALIRYTESEPEFGEWNIMLMAYDARWNGADQIPLRGVTSGFLSRLETIDDTVGGSTSRFSLSGRWHRDFGVQQITARAYAIDYELELFSNFTYFLEDPVDGDQIEQIDDRLVFGGDINWQSQYNLNSTHKIGVAIRVDDIDDVGLFRTARRTRTDTVRRDSVQQLSAGLFYEFDKTWNEYWRSSVGARTDYYDFRIRRGTLANNTESSSNWQFSPKLNIIRTFNESTEAYFSFGFGYHSNDARAAFNAFDGEDAPSASNVDPIVQSNGAEFGLRYFDNEKLSLSTAIWWLKLDSELLFVGDAGNTEASRPSRRFGLEIPVYYRLNKNWMLDLEIALTRARFRNATGAGDQIPGNLEQVVAAGVVASFDSGWYSSIRARHFGKRPLIETGAVKSGSSTVWNTALGFRSRKFDIRLELLNAFDSSDDDITYFYESRLPDERAAGIADIHFHPIEPRTVRLHVSWYRE